MRPRSVEVDQREQPRPRRPVEARVTGRLVIAGLVLLVGTLVATSQTILRHGMRQFPEQQLALSPKMIPAALSNPWIVTSLCLGLITFVAYAYLLTKVEVSFAAPMTNAVFYLVMFVIASAWLREGVTVSRAGGAALLLVAMWLLTRTAK